MKTQPIMQVLVRSSGDVLLARQRAQAIAELAEFPLIRQTSFATALSEITRNAVQFASEARVEFAVENTGNKHFLTATVSDRGPGISKVRERDGRWDPSIALAGQGIASARKLVKLFSIHCPPSGGTVVKLGLPFENDHFRMETASSWSEKLAQQKPRNLLEEMQHQNQEQVRMLEELQRKETELERQVAEGAFLNAALEESRQLLEARVRERTQSLSLSNEELRAFSYTVSHDLRAPLRAINGFIHVLLDEHVQADNAQARELAGRISQATDRMDTLIQDLVAYTQVIKVPIPLQAVDSRTLIEDLLKQCEARFATEKPLIEVKGEFPLVIANPGILHSALLNLVDNALKFRNTHQQTLITFRGTMNAQNLRLWVEDQGIGIAPEHHARIFGVFERLHGGEVPGTGIGLAMVKRWVEGMQGGVGVESKLGEGARFWIELPLSATVRY